MTITQSPRSALMMKRKLLKKQFKSAIILIAHVIVLVY